MNTARAVLVLLLAFVAGAIGYQIGVTQNIAAIPAAGAPMAYYPWHFGFGFGFFGLLFPLLFFFLIFGLLRAAFGGWNGGGGRSWGRYARLEEIHRELHGEKPRDGGQSAGTT